MGAVTDISVSWLIVVVTQGSAFDIAEVTETLLTVKLNVFALPLAAGPVEHSAWVWYVITLLWVRQWLRFFDVSPRSFVSPIQERLDGLTPVSSTTGVANIAPGDD